MKFKFEHFPPGQQHNLSDKEIDIVLSYFDDFKTWGFIGDPQDGSAISYFLVPQKKIVAPKYQSKIGPVVDYHEKSAVVVNNKDSFFCCEYLYSFDEFNDSVHRGTFKIKICPENKMILKWVVTKRFLILMNESPDTFRLLDMVSLLDYIASTPNITLPFRDVSGLAFNNDYLNLIDPYKN